MALLKPPFLCFEMGLHGLHSVFVKGTIIALVLVIFLPAPQRPWIRMVTGCLVLDSIYYPLTNLTSCDSQKYCSGFALRTPSLIISQFSLVSSFLKHKTELFLWLLFAKPRLHVFIKVCQFLPNLFVFRPENTKLCYWEQ